jgi:site-specific recombinase XerC
VRAYESDLDQLVAHLARARNCRKAELRPAHLDGQSLRGFLGELYARGHARSSTARRVSAVRSFARFLRREGALDGDPAAVVGTPRVEKKIPAHLTQDEIERLLATPDDTSPLGRRDRAILELFYASGLRLGELVGLNVDDVNVNGRMVRVLGKGRKERLVPFGRRAAESLLTWLRDREALVAASPAVGALRPPPGAAPRGVVQREVRHQPARSAPFLRHAPAAERRRPPRHPGTAGPRPALDHAALHPRERGAADGGLPQGPPARLSPRSAGSPGPRAGVSGRVPASPPSIRDLGGPPAPRRGQFRPIPATTRGNARC